MPVSMTDAEAETKLYVHPYVTAVKVSRPWHHPCGTSKIVTPGFR